LVHWVEGGLDLWEEGELVHLGVEEVLDLTLLDPTSLTWDLDLEGEILWDLAGEDLASCESQI